MTDFMAADAGNILLLYAWNAGCFLTVALLPFKDMYANIFLERSRIL